MDLNNKVCLVTGGTSGIGAAVSKSLLEKGAHVVVVARNKKDSELAELSKAAEAQKRRVTFIAADMGVAADCERAVKEATEQFGRVDVLVHSAGGPTQGSLLELTAEKWMQTFDVHVHAVFHLARAVVPGMKERKNGAILLISSTAGLRGCLGSLAYGVAKGALPQFARALARELADFNIRVNCISPGVIRTPFQVILTEAQAKHNIENRIPLHREGQPSDVAQLIVTVVENDFVTGENMVIDGGLTMRIA
ncbi:MAG TPA: SDR family oxidoreductase [Bryobacteraceae bacterium]|nr:SDR family oxidoreductase [Bryobacteraceae bacterium]